MKRRVVITGMGTVNPLGLTVAETWENVVGGVSGVGPITLFDSSDLNVHIACEVKGFDPERYMQPRDVRRSDRFEQFAVAASQEALAQSGFEVQEERADRVAVTISTAVGGLDTMQQGAKTIAEVGPRRISPFLIPMFMPNGASGLIGIEIGAKGPCFSLASACASGADSLGQAAMMIRASLVDVAIAGGAEAPISILGVSAFDRLGACSRRNEEPYTSPRPFDANRDGLVVGEGAAVLVLESLEHAKARGALILGELVGHAATADAFHVTAPSEDGAGGAAAIRAALEEAGRRVDEVDYINAHGTATQLNDVSETRAIKSALSEHAYQVPISSTKSMTGHLMGATGALEAIFCVLAIREGIILPTINLTEPDPECDLDYVPGVAREGKVDLALSNAFGFGGHNAVLAFQAFSG
jgi:3-oxoacyl-[acyl-carrier-protein] synthase II